MIAFGTAVSHDETYERVALPGIRRAAEPDCHVLVRTGHDSIQRPYNEMLDEAAGLPDLEALVLLHQDFELTDDSLPARIRRVMRDPRVGLIGSLGGRTSRLHCWTEPDQLSGTAMAPGVETRHSTGTHEVDAVDGSLLVIAPWVVRSVRFAESLAPNFHGYDVDFSFRVRAVAGKVVCDDIPYFHHMSLRTDHDAIRLAGIDLARMWDTSLRPVEWSAAFEC
jgi:GT2 family glycosyltransferase